MAVQPSLKTVDLEKLIGGVAKMELKALHAGIECVQVWISQAAKLSAIAGDTLQAIQDDKASLAATARRLTEFGKQNADAFGSLSARLNATYYGELERLTDAVGTRAVKVVDGAATAKPRAAAKLPPTKSHARPSRKRPVKAVRAVKA